MVDFKIEGFIIPPFQFLQEYISVLAKRLRGCERTENDRTACRDRGGVLSFGFASLLSQSLSRSFSVGCLPLSDPPKRKKMSDEITSFRR